MTKNNKDIIAVFSVPDENYGDMLIDLYQFMKKNGLIDYIKPSALYDADGYPKRVFVNDLHVYPGDVILVHENYELEKTDLSFDKAVGLIDVNLDDVALTDEELETLDNSLSPEDEDGIGRCFLLEGNKGAGSTPDDPFELIEFITDLIEEGYTHFHLQAFDE